MKHFIFSAIAVFICTASFAQQKPENAKGQTTTTQYFVDYVKVSRAEVDKLSAGEIASMKVYKGKPSIAGRNNLKENVVYIETKRWVAKESRKKIIPAKN